MLGSLFEPYAHCNVLVSNPHAAKSDPDLKDHATASSIYRHRTACAQKNSDAVKDVPKRCRFMLKMYAQRYWQLARMPHLAGDESKPIHGAFPNGRFLGRHGGMIRVLLHTSILTDLGLSVCQIEIRTREWAQG